MKLHRTRVAPTCIAGILLAFAPWGMAIAEAQTTDPRVADLVGAGKLRVGLFLPQYGKGPSARRSHCGRTQSRLDQRARAPSETSRVHLRRNAGANVRPNARRKRTSWPRPASFCSTSRRSWPVRGCLRTATARTSTAWSCRKARRNGAPTSTSSSRRPKPLARCNSSLSAAAPAGSRWRRWAIRIECASGPAAKRV
jgi:hypothetical protein